MRMGLQFELQEPFADPAEISADRVALVIPTLDPARHLDALLQGLREQSFRPATFLVVDSSSADGSAERLRAAGAEVLVIPRSQFDHGGTRQFAIDRLPPKIEIIVFLTQDALPAGGDAIGRLVAAFADPEVGVAYGRQLPRPDSGAIGAHARLFNYPAESATLRPEAAPGAGAKATFCSNSFAAYRRQALAVVGGFPSRTIFGEDAAVAGRMLLSG